jgi:hypothetical protein
MSEQFSAIKYTFNIKARQYRARYTTPMELKSVLSEAAGGQRVIRLWNKRNLNQVLVVNAGEICEQTVIIYTSGTGQTLRWQVRQGTLRDLMESGLYEA